LTSWRRKKKSLQVDLFSKSFKISVIETPRTETPIG